MNVTVISFRDVLNESEMSANFEDLLINNLNDRWSHITLVQENHWGSFFKKKGAIQIIRNGLNIFLKRKETLTLYTYNWYQWNIQSCVNRFEEEGTWRNRQPPMTRSRELQKLSRKETPVFDVNTGFCLQRKMWFEITLYLCIIGRENLR